MKAVFKHELRQYFDSMTAYVFGAFLLLFIGIGSMLYNLQSAVSNFEFVLNFASIVFVVIVPVLTMILATLFLREPITWLKAGGVFLGCAGALILILVSQHGTGHTSSVKGDVLCIVSAVSYATYLTAFRNVIVRYSPVTTMKWMFLFAAVAALAIYWRPLTEVDYAAVSPRRARFIGIMENCSEAPPCKNST